MNTSMKLVIAALAIHCGYCQYDNRPAGSYPYPSYGKNV